MIVAMVVLVVAALVMEMCGLLPLFQIPLLLDEDVRRYLDREEPGLCDDDPA